MSVLSLRGGAASVAALGLLGLTACGSDEPMTPDATATRLRVRIENVAPFQSFKSGTFAIKEGASAPGPIAPGEAFEFSFTAGKNHRLSFATMLGQSNDWFFAPDAKGIALFEGDLPISGDVTSQVYLWDAGSEVDEEPAVGPHTGPKQSTSTDGPGALDPNRNVRRVGQPATLTNGTSFNTPAVSSMIRVTVTSDAATRRFTVRIQNVASDTATLQTSEGFKPVRVSPGVWTVSAGNEPLFTVGAPDRGQGLEAIAETGDVSGLAAALAPLSGVATPLSPGVFVLHTGSAPLFTEGAPDRGQGLGDIAERGDITRLSSTVAMSPPMGVRLSGMFNTPVGAAAPGPILPGGAYEFDVEALPSERLSFAVMYGASNDWVFGPGERGIALFDAAGKPVTGDVTSQVYLWDVGTELSEEPAVGAHIGAPKGAVDPDAIVRQVPLAGYGTPVSRHLRVTVSVP